MLLAVIAFRAEVRVPNGSCAMQRPWLKLERTREDTGSSCSADYRASSHPHNRYRCIVRLRREMLVVDDMLGLFSAFQPSFVKRYAELGSTADAAIAAYANEVRERRFPALDHVFGDEPGMM